MHNFKLVNLDTDSIMFCKQDGSSFEPNECQSLLNDLNLLMFEKIKFDNDGLYKKVLVFKAKTYVLFDGIKIKVKGSALKSSQLEVGFREYIDEMLHSILEDKNDYKQIYDRYIKRLCNITSKEEIKLFSSKKTLSNTTYSSTRTNETKLIDAIEGVEVVVGDRVWVFFLPDGKLCLSEHFKGEYDKVKMLEKLYKVSHRFAGVIDVTSLLNYKLKKNKIVLEELLK